MRNRTHFGTIPLGCYSISEFITSMTILAPSVNPLTNASRSAIPYISLVHSVNLSRISISSSFSRFFRSSSCLTMYPSNSEYLLPFLKSLSQGEMLPYHNSSMMFISHLRDKERAAPPREIPIQNRSVLIIYLFLTCHMYYLLFVVAHTISQKGTEVQREYWSMIYYFVFYAYSFIRFVLILQEAVWFLHMSE